MKESYFDGKLLQLIGWNILGFLVTFFTLGICYPWAICMVKSWEVKHTVISGQRMRFDGTPMQLFGTWIKWWALTIVTFGIYAFWLPIKSRQWVTRHTVFYVEESAAEKSYTTGEAPGRETESLAMHWGKKDVFIVCAATFLGLVVLGALFGAGSGERSKGAASASGEAESHSGYLTEATWALGESYSFAVEVDGFSGDIFQAGTFEFYPEEVNANKIQAIYDVYTGYEEYSSISDVTANCEFIGSVGGIMQESFTAELDAGCFVYVVFNEVAGGDHGNVLHIANTSAFGSAETEEPPPVSEQPSSSLKPRSPAFAVIVVAIMMIVLTIVLIRKDAGALSGNGLNFNSFVTLMLVGIITTMAGAAIMWKLSWWGLLLVAVGIGVLLITEKKV